jgi:hypothetical protein
MIQIELPCCDISVEIEADAVTVRCEACAIEHVFAEDAWPRRHQVAPEPELVAVAA